MFYYSLYNKSVISDIRLFNIPQTTKSISVPDIIIHNGIICDVFASDNVYLYMFSDSAYLRFRYGTLQINNGNEIIYSLKNGYNPESITPFIMGWGMAILLTQNEHSAFHCSALCRNNQGFFISGVSGAGKSTTSLELLKHGCSYLADDIGIVDSYENMMITPAFPIQKVCPNISSDLNSNNLYSINNDRGKYAYLNEKDYCNTPKKLTVFFQLLLGETDQVEIKEITGIEKYLKVLECLFLGVKYSSSSFPEPERFRCLKIAGNIRLFTITRPVNKNTLDEITYSILKILDEQGD